MKILILCNTDVCMMWKQLINESVTELRMKSNTPDLIAK